MRILLVLALLLAPTAAASTLFTDPAGDAGPAALVGDPVSSSYADLVGADAEANATTLTIHVRVAALPQDLPPDTLWSVGWKDGEREIEASYARFTTPEGDAEGASACVMSSSGAPACVEIPGAREPHGFRLDVPRAFLANGSLAHLHGIAMRLFSPTAWPLFVVDVTQAGVLDRAAGADAAFPNATQETALAPAGASPGTPTRAVPGLAWGATLALCGVALMRRP